MLDFVAQRADIVHPYERTLMFGIKCSVGNAPTEHSKNTSFLRLGPRKQVDVKDLVVSI